MRIWSMIAVSSALLLSAGAATAQTLISVPDFGAPDIYGRGKNTSVLERERPDYQALGIHNGGFTIYPRLVITGETDNNVYAAPDHCVAGTPVTGCKVSDTLVMITPSVVAQSNWGRHSLSFSATLNQALFNHYKTENTTAWTLTTNGRVDVHGESYINLGADAQHQFEARGSEVSVINTVHPVSFNTEGVYLRGLYGQDRFRGAIDATYRTYAYQNQDDTQGHEVFENLRDFHDYSIAGRVDYALTPDEAVFGKFTYGETTYLNGDMNVSALLDKRNSTQTNGIVGGNFDITGLARGEVGVGYVDRKYESKYFKEVSGLSVAAKVEYFPTQLLTLTLVGQRQVNDSSFSTSGGYFQNTVTGEADYEVRRNIILSGAAGYERDEFPGLGRTDSVWNGQLQGRYFLTREVGLGAKLSYLKRDSNLAYPSAPHYDETRFALSLVFQR